MGFIAKVAAAGVVAAATVLATKNKKVKSTVKGLLATGEKTAKKEVKKVSSAAKSTVKKAKTAAKSTATKAKAAAKKPARKARRAVASATT